LSSFRVAGCPVFPQLRPLMAGKEPLLHTGNSHNAMDQPQLLKLMSVTSKIRKVAADLDPKLPTVLVSSPYANRKEYTNVGARKQRRLARHLAVCCTVMFAEGFYATQMFPYVSTMTEELRGDTELIGPYTGLLYTSQSVGMLLSAYVWAAASNRYGRRICLIFGVSFNIATSFFLACSTDYWITVFLRILAGLTNNNLSILRTSLREFFMQLGADDTTAFSMLSVAFGASSVAGPSVGGLLYIRLPGVDGAFLQPWAPPFLLCTAMYCVSLAVIVTWLPETSSLDHRNKQETVLIEKDPKGGVQRLLRELKFILLLIMAGGHSYIFTGWELVYPLFARLHRDAGGEDWLTSDIGLTFLVGSIGLMSYSLLVYPKVAKLGSTINIWIWQWVLPILIMPIFPRLVQYALIHGYHHKGAVLHLLNFGSQLIMSILLGSKFISVQLLLNNYVAGQQELLALANGYLVSTQALVRAMSPLSTGSLFTFGVQGHMTGLALPFDHLALAGLVCGVACAVAFAHIQQGAV